MSSSGITTTVEATFSLNAYRIHCASYLHDVFGLNAWQFSSFCPASTLTATVILSSRQCTFDAEKIFLFGMTSTLPDLSGNVDNYYTYVWMPGQHSTSQCWSHLACGSPWRWGPWQEQMTTVFCMSTYSTEQTSSKRLDAFCPPCSNRYVAFFFLDIPLWQALCGSVSFLFSCNFEIIQLSCWNIQKRKYKCTKQYD